MSWSPTDAVSDALAAVITPDSGMTAAIAPATGNQTIIQISSSFLKYFMFCSDKDNADWFTC